MLVSLNSDKLQSRVNINKTNIQLAPGIKSTLKLNISIPDNFELGEYSILITGTSLSDETVSDEVTIMVKVIGKDLISIYGVAISVLPNSIEIVQDKSENVTLIITNVGNIRDAYTITFESNDFTIADINLSDTFLSLREGVEAQITVMITVPDDIKPGEYKLEFIAKNDMASNNTSLMINVIEVDGEIKPDDGKPKEENIMISVGIWIIIIILIILIVVSGFYFYYRKKYAKKEEAKDKEIPIKSAGIPTLDITIKKDSVAIIPKEPTVNTEKNNDAQQLKTTLTSIPTLPSSTQITKANNYHNIKIRWKRRFPLVLTSGFKFVLVWGSIVSNILLLNEIRCICDVIF